MRRKALLSVTDKTGIVELARRLVAMDIELVSTGGTAKTIKDAGVAVTSVEDVTEFPEILDGRVKTLHPKIHGGLLAQRKVERHMETLLRHSIGPIDVLVCNLYAFEKTVADPKKADADKIENIDIGGPALVRSAGKNYEDVVLLTDPSQYEGVLTEMEGNGGAVGDATKFRLAAAAFRRIAAYDAVIADYFTRKEDVLFPDQLTTTFRLWKKLRYGENPHQQGALYLMPGVEGPLGGTIVQEGKGLSYTNLLDLDMVYRAVCCHDMPTVAISKHVSLCGLASGRTLAYAYEAANLCDPISAFGGIVASNRPVDQDLADALIQKGRFIEAIVAPGYESGTAEILAQKHNCRILCVPAIPRHLEMRTVLGGLLVQERDRGDPDKTAWDVVSKRQPHRHEWADLHFAWKALPFIQSNTIVIARGEQTVGIGGGQPSRVDAAKIAVEKAGERAKDGVAVSDAFFPFPDAIEVLAKAGVSAIAHTGGSVRDSEGIACADAHDLAMIITGVRHFRH
jgi:phosphoribosylaminoimidazolecarboxamide formyltransferase/IMP cyclohydrolase